LEGREQVLLVNRGWITAGPSRDVLPEVTAPAGLVRLQGVLDFPPRPGIRLGDTVVVTDRWPLVMLELDSVLLSARLGAEVLPLSLLITHDADTRLLQDDVRGRDFKPERHLGYAVQWFGLALALIVIFLAVNTRAGEVRHEDRG
jgi:surfeit locus 1 family protein